MHSSNFVNKKKGSLKNKDRQYIKDDIFID